MSICAVIRGSTEIIHTRSKFDDGIRGDGSEQLVHIRDTDSIAVHRHSGGIDFCHFSCCGTGCHSKTRQDYKCQHGCKESSTAFLIVHDLL